MHLYTESFAKKVTLNGKLSSDFYKSGNSIGVDLIKVEPGETIVLTYNVMVREGTQKTVRVEENEEQEVIDKMVKDNTITLTNVVNAIGNNGSASAEDSNVKVPPIVETIPEEGGNVIDPPMPDQPTCVKSTEKTIVDLTKDPDNVYTITLENPSDEVWKNVKVEDRINTVRAHLYADSVTVDGRHLDWGSGYVYKVDKDSMIDTIIIPVGDIKPGQKVVVQFKLKFTNDMSKEPYINKANATSDNFPSKEGVAPTVTFMNPQPFTGLHQVLYQGFKHEQDYGWWPRYDKAHPHRFLSLQEACCVVGRSLTEERRGEMLNGESIGDAVADLKDFPAIQDWQAGPVRFYMIVKAITENEIDVNKMSADIDYVDYLNTTRIVATRNQLGRLLKSSGFHKGALAGDYSSQNPLTRTSRIDFANEMCKITGRDQDPNYNGCETNIFPDAREDVVQEVSTWHNYVLVGGIGGEIWTYSDKSRPSNF